MPPRLHLPAILKSPHARALGRYTVSLALWFPAFVLFTDNVYSVERVTGRSMSPNFCPPTTTSKDYILAQHWGAVNNLRRGQVILFRSPIDPERQAIKRIVALEGDVVRARPSYPQKLVVVPRGQIWVEGDEAFHSLDSNSYGPIPIALITAKVSHILLPLARAGAVAQEERLSRAGALARRAVMRVEELGA